MPRSASSHTRFNPQSSLTRTPIVTAVFVPAVRIDGDRPGTSTAGATLVAIGTEIPTGFAAWPAPSLAENVIVASPAADGSTSSTPVKTAPGGTETPAGAASGIKGTTTGAAPPSTTDADTAETSPSGSLTTTTSVRVT